MSRTYKKIPHGYYRHPRGKKQALINGVRFKAIPPDSWEDEYFDKQVWLPQAQVEKMMAVGLSGEEIAHKLRRKFKVSYLRAYGWVQRENWWRYYRGL